MCSVQSCPFVQCWPKILLVQCREILYNVGAVFAATGYYQKISQVKIKIAEKWYYSDDITLGCLLGNIAQDFHLCNVVPRVLQHYWTGVFHLQCCLEPLRQHLTKFLPVQCCPKSIKTILNRIFPCAMLSGANWITLHKVFSCAMLSGANWAILDKDFTCAMLSQEY